MERKLIKNKFFVVICFLLLHISTSEAQSLLVVDENGVQEPYALGHIRKITFSEYNLKIFTYDTNYNEYTLSSLSFLNFADWTVDNKPLAQNTNQFSAYPNPTNDKITIKITEPNCEFGQVEIMNIEGKVLKTLEVNLPSDCIIDLTNFQKGLYMCRFHGNNTNQVLKIVKQ